MSRVTVKDLYSDYVNIETPVEDCKKVLPIEIVPRRIVEMIIQKCDYDMSRLNSQYTYECGVINEAERIKDFAESLLTEFEGDKDEN